MEFPFNRVSQIQSTAYCRTVLQIHSTSAQKGKNVLKFQKFQKILESVFAEVRNSGLQGCSVSEKGIVSHTIPFSLTLQHCSPESLRQQIQALRKMFLLSVPE